MFYVCAHLLLLKYSKNDKSVQLNGASHGQKTVVYSKIFPLEGNQEFKGPGLIMTTDESLVRASLKSRWGRQSSKGSRPLSFKNSGSRLQIACTGYIE